MSEDDKRLMSPQATSRKWGIGLNNLYGMLHRGEVPCLRIGNRWKIPPQAFAQWVEQQARRAG